MRECGSLWIYIHKDKPPERSSKSARWWLRYPPSPSNAHHGHTACPGTCGAQSLWVSELLLHRHSKDPNREEDGQWYRKESTSAMAASPQRTIWKALRVPTIDVACRAKCPAGQFQLEELSIPLPWLRLPRLLGCQCFGQLLECILGSKLVVEAWTPHEAHAIALQHVSR